MRGGRHFLGSSVPLLLALALAACGGAPPAQGPQVPQVTVATPLVKPILDWDEYVGRFEAVQAVEVRPRVSGYVSRLAFRDGQFAKAGELLFEIDPRPYRAALAQAQAQAARAKAAAALAKANLARTEKLFADAVVAQEEVDTARANAAGAQADLAAAEAAAEQRALDLGFTRVTAPIGGRLSDRRVSVGGYVTAGQTVLTSVVSMNPIYFSFTGSESIYLKYTRANQAGTRPSSRVAPNPVEIRLADEPT
ncbi:MAG: efflux RND transporter periplasmic adaptor subunit [Sphingomonadales bacterium]